jgi:hypothetical protein
MSLHQKSISGDLVEVAENNPSKDHTLMQTSKLAFKLRQQITQFSGYVSTGVDSRQMIPLYQELYSQEAPDFTSENNQILQAIDRVSEAVENRGIWVIDRGGDRNVLFDRLLDEKALQEFIIRLVGDRHLVHRGKKHLALALAHRCPTPYRQTILKKEQGKDTTYELEFGYLSVRLPDHQTPLWMLVVKGYGKKPMMLLTTRPLRRNRKILWRILRSYIKRWDIEQSIRFVKQCYDVENIRLLNYVRLRNMMGLLLAVFYFMAVKLDTSAKLTIMSGAIFKAAKRVFGIPDFKYYAMSDGLSAIFKRSPGKLPSSPFAEKDPMQLGFGFT